MTKINAKTLANAGLGLAILTAPTIAFHTANLQIKKHHGLPASIAFTLAIAAGLFIWDAATTEAYDPEWQKVLDDIDGITPETEK